MFLLAIGVNERTEILGTLYSLLVFLMQSFKGTFQLVTFVLNPKIIHLSMAMMGLP